MATIPLMPPNDELNALAEAIRATDAFRHALQRTALFDYLWTNRDGESPAIDIWEGALHKLSRSNKKDDADYDYDESVRQSCLDLRKALRRYFAGGSLGWKLDLPAAIPGLGYRLKIERPNNTASAAFEFWKAHLYPPRNVAVVYTEEMFYQHWPEHLTFRYFHLNAEQENRALDELKEQHREMYDKYKDNLVVAYPYVAAGDIEARDLITSWFDENTLVKVQSAITRRMDDRAIAESSLILLGTAATNRMIADILRSSSAQHLAFRLQEGGAVAEGRRYGRVIVKDPTEEEMRRFANYGLVRDGSNCALDFSPEQGRELAILSRVANPYTESAVTIINAHSGRAVEQVARLLTSEDRMRAGTKQLDWPAPTPVSFEILYAIPIGSIATDHRRAMLEPLAWRTYDK